MIIAEALIPKTFNKEYTGVIKESCPSS